MIYAVYVNEVVEPSYGVSHGEMINSAVTRGALLTEHKKFVMSIPDLFAM